ncbi:MAG: sphingomyelin phosphodiesterase [Bacteroidota bacterium]|nr:sphingomyelin phosphodiesterase [Bacteroidota bacterium]
MRKNGWLLVSILSVLSSLNLFAQQPETCPFEANSQQLKILSWNIYMLPYVSWFNHNGHRARAIGKQLQDSDFQIVVFQEAFSIKCRRIIRKMLAEKYPYQYGPANSSLWPFKTSSGLWILSKIPLTELKTIKFHAAKGYDKIARKGAVLFEGSFNGAKFQLMATHLQADNPYRIRQAQCQEISQLLGEFYEVDIPQILCGDFNTEMSDRQNYEQMLQTLDAQNGELAGQLKVTYDERNNNLAWRPNGKGEIIDYILTRNSHLIDNIQRKVLEFYHSEPRYKTHLSDHYAMEATVHFSTVPVSAFIANH